MVDSEFEVSLILERDAPRVYNHLASTANSAAISMMYSVEF